MQTPDFAVQNPIVALAPSDLPGIATRMKPFIGQLGSTPKRPMPDSHNAGDFGAFLLGAPHEYAQTEETLKDKTDGHMDINKVRQGAILICPVKVAGAGIYAGDVHAMQGEGEIAGHTTDVCATITLKVNVIKNLPIDGPVLLPVIDDVPYLAKPLTDNEKKIAAAEQKKWNQPAFEDSAPVSVIGTGANLNLAIENGLQRGADLFDMTVPEVMNRTTISGAIEIGRAPGVVTITFRVPKEKLEEKQLWNLVLINQLREKIGVMFGNPETTTGGNALKFYASVRLDIRRATQLKDGEEVIGNQVRVKVVKNKVAPPFRKAEFDIMFGEGISRSGEIIDLGAELGIIKKSGSWYSYNDTKLGQGRDAAKQCIQDNPELADELEKLIFDALKDKE